MIARNILANAVGGSWFAILTLLIIPVQIRVLGVDAYGLIAFLASLQIIFSVFDLGLSPTIARELAIDTSTDLQHSRDLLQTLTFAYAGVGLLMGGIVALGADWLANDWLNLGGLPVDEARTAIQLGAIALMVRWPVSFLAGVIMGRERFVILNLLKAVSATIGLLGGAVVILVSSSLVAFTAWMALAAAIEVTLYLVACFRLVPNLNLWPRVSRAAIERVRRYVLGVSVIGVLGTALTQSDRLLLSTLLPIETLGYYSLAFNLLLGLTLVQGFFTSALLPRFAAIYEQSAVEKLATDYNRASKGLIYLCTLPVSALLFFGEPLLSLWTSPETAAPASRILTILAPAFLINVAVSIPYILALATGNTGIVVRVYGVALAFYLPALYIAIEHWGGTGAAMAWLFLNASYLFSLVPLVQQRIVGESAWTWVVHNLLPFALLGAAVFGAGRLIVDTKGWHSGVASSVVCVLGALVYAVGGIRLLDPAMRASLRALIAHLPLVPGSQELR